MKKLYDIALIGAGILLAGVVVLFLMGRGASAGWWLIGGLLLLAFGIRRSAAYAGLSFTVLIAVAVSLAMYHPEWLQNWGGFELKKLIIPLIQIIMFGMGSQSSLDDFAGVLKNPKGVLVGVVSHYIIMPTIGYLLATLLPLPPAVATGIILVGCSPSGMASNVMAFIARANVPLSVTVTAISTLLAPFVTPALLKWLAGQFVPIDFWKMVMEILNITILPIVAGLMFNAMAYLGQSRGFIIRQLVVYIGILILKNALAAYTSGASLVNGLLWDAGIFLALPMLAGWLFGQVAHGRRETLEKILSLSSMIGIAVIAMVITAAGQKSLLDVGVLLLVACLIHNLLGYTLGYWTCRAVGLSEQSSRSVAFEVGMQNAGMASGLALQMGQLATTGLAPAIFGPLMNTTGSMLANWWRNRIPKNTDDADEPVSLPDTSSSI